MFGAWQAGAWRALSHSIEPDLVVGASVGALNGWAIAGGASPEQLIDFWMRPEIASFANLAGLIRDMTERFPLKTRYAAVLTDLVRLKPVIVCDGDVTCEHLAASCAVPGVLPQVRIGGRWYSDGGLLNPLPVWAAVDLGATDIVAVHPIWPQPAFLIRPLVRGFVGVFGHHPQVPKGVRLETLSAPPLGSIYDAMHWKRENIERWIEQGYEAGIEFCKKHFASELS